MQKSEKATTETLICYCSKHMHTHKLGSTSFEGTAEVHLWYQTTGMWIQTAAECRLKRLHSCIILHKMSKMYRPEIKYQARDQEVTENIETLLKLTHPMVGSVPKKNLWTNWRWWHTRTIFCLGSFWRVQPSTLGLYMSPFTAAQMLRCKEGSGGCGCQGRTENVKPASLS